ncbi:MAG: SURF1 family protein [Halieaceae bacterium]|jgi:cytochrome oxidase assembly protein ShyY1|nr:SURF1 family protein [Halieaceae bacterium]
MASTAAQTPALRWDLEWRSALFAALFVPLFVGLGFWQLARAEEKRAIGQQWEQRRQLPPAALESLPSAPAALAYRRVRLQGRFLEQYSFLLDNRIRDGRYGVEVITPYQAGTALVLVNRGWLEGDPYRRALPEIPPPPQLAVLEGSVYVMPGESYTLGSIDSGQGWPRLIQAIDVPAMAEMLGKPLWPYTVRLSLDSPAALLADWPLVNVRPEKHSAYAVQWFGMALALAALGIWRNTTLPALVGSRRAGGVSAGNGDDHPE